MWQKFASKLMIYWASRVLTPEAVTEMLLLLAKKAAKWSTNKIDDEFVADLDKRLTAPNPDHSSEAL